MVGYYVLRINVNERLRQYGKQLSKVGEQQQAEKRINSITKQAAILQIYYNIWIIPFDNIYTYIAILSSWLIIRIEFILEESNYTSHHCQINYGPTSIFTHYTFIMNCHELNDQSDEEHYQQLLLRTLQLFPKREIPNPRPPIPQFQHFTLFINKLRCKICQQIAKKPFYLQCSHRVCKECLMRQLSRASSKLCPVCRQHNIGSKNTKPDKFLKKMMDEMDNWLQKLDDEWRQQPMLKREREEWEKEQTTKLFKSNHGRAIALKIECQDESNQMLPQSKKQTNENTERTLLIIKAQPIISFPSSKSKQNHTHPHLTQNQHTRVALTQKQQQFSLIDCQPIYVKIRLQKKGNRSIWPNLPFSQILVNCSSILSTLSVLIADYFNINQQSIKLYIKVGQKYKKIDGRDQIGQIVSNKQAYLTQKMMMRQELFRSISSNQMDRVAPQFTSLQVAATVYYTIQISHITLQ